MLLTVKLFLLPSVMTLVITHALGVGIYLCCFYCLALCSLGPATTICNSFSSHLLSLLLKVQSGNMFLIQFTFFKKIIYLFTLQDNISTPFSFQDPLPHTQIHPSFSVSLQKRQASQGYQPNMTYQVAIRLSTSHHIKAGQGNPLGGKGSQNQESETARASTVRRPTRRPSYITMTYTQRA